MLERAKEATRNGRYTYVEYARWADDLVILVDGYRRHDWLLRAVDRRLREELAKLDLKLNEDKSRLVDLSRGEAFGFLGFDFRRVHSLRGVWRPQYTPKLKQRTALLAKLREICTFRRHHSQPVRRVIALVNPVVRGWVNYFRIGHASRCFAYVQDWVEKKLRRHLMRARNRPGFGWKRWSREWLYRRLGLYADYRGTWAAPESAPGSIGLITLGAKPTGKPGAGNRLAGFDAARTGDGPFPYRASPRPYRSGDGGFVLMAGPPPTS